MEGYFGEIRGFAGTFNPQNWASCEGQTLMIRDNNPLFAMIGTIYGGDGVSTFKLPDLRGRVPVGFGQGPGLSFRALGTTAGTEYTQLSYDQMPVHNHTAVTSSMSVAGTAGGSVILPCYSDAGGANSPVNNVMGTASGAYAAAGDADASMAPVPVSLSLNGSVSGNVAIGYTGSSLPYSNIQPSLAIRWIICINGMWPDRD